MRHTLICSRHGKGQSKGITTSSHWQASQTETLGKKFSGGSETFLASNGLTKGLLQCSHQYTKQLKLR